MGLMINLGFYGILPANVRYDKNLTDKAKLLYAEITAALDYTGECEEDIAYFSRLLDLTGASVRGHMRSLISGGYVCRETANKINMLSLPQKVVKVEEKKKEIAESSHDVVVEAIRLWNKLFKKELKVGLRKTDELSQTVTDRLVSFSKDDIMAALQNRHDFVRNSEWHNKPENMHHMPNISKVLGSDTVLLQNLNMTVQQRPPDWKTTTKKFNANEDNELILE
jgi:hypothetical protein